MTYKLRVSDEYLDMYIAQCEELNTFTENLKQSLKDESEKLRYMNLQSPAFVDSVGLFSKLQTRINTNKKEYHGDVIGTANEIERNLIDLMQLSVEMTYKYNEIMTQIDTSTKNPKRSKTSLGLEQAKKRIKYQNH